MEKPHHLDASLLICSGLYGRGRHGEEVGLTTTEARAHDENLADTCSFQVDEHPRLQPPPSK